MRSVTKCSWALMVRRSQEARNGNPAPRDGAAFNIRTLAKGENL